MAILTGQTIDSGVSLTNAVYLSTGTWFKASTSNELEGVFVGDNTVVTPDGENSYEFDTQITFGDTFINSNSVKETATIINIHTSPIDVEVSAPTYFETKKTSETVWGSSISSFSIASESSEDIDYRFSPLISGEFTDDSDIDYEGLATRQVELTGVGLSLSIANPKYLNFGKIIVDTQSEEKNIQLINGSPVEITVDITMPKGFKVQDGANYVSVKQVTIPAESSFVLDVIAEPYTLGTIRGVLNLELYEQNVSVYLTVEGVVSEYMNIRVFDDGKEVGRLEKEVIVLDRRKLINTETDRTVLNESPATDTKIIDLPEGTSSVLIYSKYYDEDSYWRLRVVNALNTTTSAASAGNNYYDLPSDTIAPDSRLLQSTTEWTEFDFFDRSEEPFIVRNSNIVENVVVEPDNEFLKVEDTIGFAAYLANLHSIDTPHLLAYIPVAFADRLLVKVNKLDKEFEVICLQEV